MQLILFLHLRIMQIEGIYTRGRTRIVRVRISNYVLKGLTRWPNFGIIFGRLTFIFFCNQDDWKCFIGLVGPCGLYLPIVDH
jgi:hypothetical protein